MSSLNHLSGFCVFCLKSVPNENISNIFKFLTCLKRYLGESTLCKLFTEFIKETPLKVLTKCCRDCQILLEAFCDMYCEIKLLKLKLEWKLRQLIRIMKLASRVPRRVCDVNTILDSIVKNDEDKTEYNRNIIKNLRQHIIKTGHQKSLGSQPRVLLNRLENIDDNNLSNPFTVKGQAQINLNINQQVDPNIQLTEAAPTTNHDLDQTRPDLDLNNVDDVDINSISLCGSLIAHTDKHETDGDDNTTDYTAVGNHQSKDDPNQQVVLTQMKLENGNLHKEIPHPDHFPEQDVVPVPNSLLLNENDNTAKLPTNNEKSTISPNKLYCCHCKKKFKSVAWLGVHNRKFHPSTVSTPKDETSMENAISTFKTEDDANVNMTSTTKSQGRYNLREKRNRKILALDENDSEDNTSESLSSMSSTSESENDMEVKPEAVLVIKRVPKTIIFRRKSKSIIRKYRPRKKVPVKPECEEVNGVKCFRCKICKLTFVKSTSLRRHIFGSHKFKGLKITSKEVNTTTSSTLTSKPVQSSFKCNFCEVVMEYPSDLAIHETEHVPRVETEEELKSRKYLKCPRCKFQYHQTQKAAYIRHHLKVHLKVLGGNHSSACAMCSGGNVYAPNSVSHYNIFHNINKLEDPTKISKCDLCSAFFIKARQLYRHKYLIHDQNNHKCEICDEVFQTRVGLRDHKTKYHKKWDENPNFPIGCDVEGCKKRFKTQGEFEYHKHFHQNLTPWKYVKEKCSQCEKVFRSKAQLHGHINKAHCEKICQLCGKGFKTNSALQIHLIYHKNPNQWKFQCEECGKKCATRTKLDEHMRTHTKEKPFVCQFCGEKYAHRHNWRNHVKAKHEDEVGVDEEITKITINFKEARFMSRKGSKKGDCIIAGGSTEPQN